MSYLVKNIVNSNPANPTGTTNGIYTLMGLSVLFTARSSGRALITITGDMANATNGEGIKMRGEYGTGAAPVNGTLTSGLQFTSNLALDMVSAAAARYPFHVSGILTMTIGTQYWIDLAIGCPSAGTASVVNIIVSGIEL